MYSFDDMRTPRDRVSDDFARRMLEVGSCGCGAPACPVAARMEQGSAGRCVLPDGTALAMVYSPCQLWRSLYAPDMALRRGTMFKELDMPFSGDGAKGGCGNGK